MKIAKDKKLLYKCCNETLERWKYEAASDENLKLLQDEIQAALKKVFNDVKSVIAEQINSITEVTVLDTSGVVYIITLVPYRK